MKKLFSFLGLLILTIALFVLSCKKNNDIFFDKTSHDVNDAKGWYKQNTEKKIFEAALQPDWKEAKISNSKSGEKIIIVPANQGNNTNNPKVGILTSFVFSGKSGKIESGKIIRIVGDASSIEQQQQQIVYMLATQAVPRLERAGVFIYDINRNLKVRAAIKNGALASDLEENLTKSSSISLNIDRYPGVIKKGSKGKLQLNLPSSYNTQGESHCTDWYWTTWNTSTGEVISEEYVFTTCEDEGDGFSSTGVANSPPPCLQSFHFVQKIGIKGNTLYEGGWQIAAIEGLRVRYVMPQQPVVQLNFPRLYFGLPVLRFGETNVISYEMAQSMAAEAVRIAEIAGLEMYKVGLTDVTTLNIVYMNALKTAMAEFMGRVGTDPGLNIVIPSKDVSTATYPGLLGIGCF
ncbi:MAG: hypothetical protein K0R59_162 [Sphingobacterium sp.]|jgi:hypothetical protein|nr:hypothetical protein [Sphingobacterium sp.]